MTRNDSLRWIQADDVLVRAGPFGLVLAGGRTGGPVTLTGTGPATWDLLARPRSLDAVSTSLAARFGATPSVVRQDVGTLFDELVREGLIHPAGQDRP